MDEASSKRRRGLGVVTPNACTECRKKRAKCDGQVPCGRCASQKGVDCVYEVPVRQSKDHMRSQIELLKMQQRQNERVLAALASTGDSSDQVLSRLRDGETAESIAEELEKYGGTVITFPSPSDRQLIGEALRPLRNISVSSASASGLRDATSPESSSRGQHRGYPWPAGSHADEERETSQHEDPMTWDSDHPPNTYDGLSLLRTWHQRPESHPTPDSTTIYARDMSQDTILGHQFRQEGQVVTVSNFDGHWTAVTSDVDFIEHLMALYFCWEYPTFASLSKEHFLHDFRKGTQRHCSPLLVNSIIALGCKFSNQPNARTDPEDSNTAGDHFFAEAIRLLELQEDRHILTTVQALGLLSLREAGCGRSSESIFLSGQSIRLAIEMGLHLEGDQKGTHKSEEEEAEHAVRSATFWGAFSLDQAWSLSIGRLPQFSRDTKLVTKPAIIEHVEASSWVPSTDGSPLEGACTQPSNVRSVYKTFCELSEIVHHSLYTLYTPGVKVTTKTLLNSYTRYLSWYDAIPTTLRLGQNFTPAVLFAHMYYHYAILLLFRPFVKLEINGSGVSPRDVCLQAADAVSALVNSYSQLYTLRRTPSFVPYFVLTSTIVHMVTLGTTNTGTEILRQGVAYLNKLSECHGFAVRGFGILCYLSGHWNIDISLDDTTDKLKDYKQLCRSSSTSMNQFCPNIASVDMVNNLGSASEDENPLFWVFPLQGRPLLATNLAETGFSLSL